jgi:hypothetical protein
LGFKRQTGTYHQKLGFKHEITIKQWGKMWFTSGFVAYALVIT